jgi:hypothetical protein
MRAVVLYSRRTGHVLGGHTDRSSSSTERPTVASLLGENRSLELPVVTAGPPDVLATLTFAPEELDVAVTTDPALMGKSFTSLGVSGSEHQVAELVPSGAGMLTAAKVTLPSAAAQPVDVEIRSVAGSDRLVINSGQTQGTFTSQPPTPALLLVAGYEPQWVP